MWGVGVAKPLALQSKKWNNFNIFIIYLKIISFTVTVLLLLCKCYCNRTCGLFLILGSGEAGDCQGETLTLE